MRKSILLIFFCFLSFSLFCQSKAELDKALQNHWILHTITNNNVYLGADKNSSQQIIDKTSTIQLKFSNDTCTIWPYQWYYSGEDSVVYLFTHFGDSSSSSIYLKPIGAKRKQKSQVLRIEKISPNYLNLYYEDRESVLGYGMSPFLTFIAMDTSDCFSENNLLGTWYAQDSNKFGNDTIKLTNQDTSFEDADSSKITLRFVFKSNFYAGNTYSCRVSETPKSSWYSPTNWSSGGPYFIQCDYYHISIENPYWRINFKNQLVIQVNSSTYVYQILLNKNDLTLIKLTV